MGVGVCVNGEGGETLPWETKGGVPRGGRIGERKGLQR